MRQVGFEASIVELKVKRLASEDKSLRVTFQVDSPDPGLAAALDELFKPGGDRVGVAVAEQVKKSNG